MKCAWKELLCILPLRFRPLLDEPWRDKLQELRLRLGHAPLAVLSDGALPLRETVRNEDLHFVVNTASRYSPWLASAGEGYITAAGGHRIGVCGDVVLKDNSLSGFRNISSLNIRVARDFPGFSRGLETLDGSLLILGKPGSGKTTLLRDLIRCRSARENIGVVDQRQEIFPPQGGFDAGTHTDILTGCPKGQGIELLLRTMTPDVIAVDEITAQADCNAILGAGQCGVSFLATAHAASAEDLYRRPVYRALVEAGIFTQCVRLNRDKSWQLERISLCK